MIMIKRCQKAPSQPITDDELVEVFAKQGVLLGSPKLDGFRCITSGTDAHTSSMKSIVNRHVRGILSRPEYAGLDGEICVGPPNAPDVFQRTTSALRRIEGEPDFCFYVFDCHNYDSVYGHRLHFLRSEIEGLAFVKVIEQTKLNSPVEVLRFEQNCVEDGYEGAMIRSPHGLYKEGRCTFKEMNIFKRKPVEDDEAVIVGMIEQQLNLNEATVNEMGLMTRQSNQENKVGKDTLGAFVVRSKKWGVDFNIGTGIGLNDELRLKIWRNQSQYFGKVITYKFQKYGSVDAPRCPIFKGFRSLEDMTDY